MQLDVHVQYGYRQDHVMSILDSVDEFIQRSSTKEKLGLPDHLRGIGPNENPRRHRSWALGDS